MKRERGPCFWLEHLSKVKLTFIYQEKEQMLTSRSNEISIPKLNTRSTHAELILDRMMVLPHTLWILLIRNAAQDWTELEYTHPRPARSNVYSQKYLKYFLQIKLLIRFSSPFKCTKKSVVPEMWALTSRMPSVPPATASRPTTEVRKRWE